jgi:hypothetical protein
MTMSRNFLLITAALLLSAGAHAQTTLKMSGNAVVTVSNGGQLYVTGGIQLDNNSSLSNAGTITIAKTGAGTADFTDSTTIPYHYGTGSFIFSGSGTQQIYSSNQFGEIRIENTGLDLATDVRANKWLLKTGIVNTGAFTAIANATDALAIEADISNINFTNAWFNGNLRRAVAPATVNQYVFPVGNATRVNRAELDNLTANPLTGVANITVSFGPKPGTDVGLNVTENSTAYNTVNTGGVWFITPDASPAGGSYDLNLYFNSFTGLFDNAFGMLGRPTASSNAADWVIPAGGVLPAAGNPGRTVLPGFARRNGITGFNGQVGIGTVLTALPLNLLVFSGERKVKDILLRWQTTRQVNTDHFDIFKGSLPTTLQYTDRVAATTNTGNATDNYTFLDRQPFKGANYYRLKIVDRDNSFQWSPVIRVDMNDKGMPLLIYPNPVAQNRVLYIQSEDMVINQASLFAADGKMIAGKLSLLSQGQLIKVILPFSLARGMYTLRLDTDKGVKTETLVVE